MTRQIPYRLAQLLAGAAAGELGEGEGEELASLGCRPPEQEQMMQVAALAQLAFMAGDRKAPGKMPQALRARLEQQAAAWNRGQPS